jgi:tRNA pseudouridine55 synthase
MNGILLIDKPTGPTSHDVVARIRNIAKERSVGHTGTLDPMATGLLPLVMGKATRLAPYFSGSDKTYVAEVRFGFETSTDDAQGVALGDPSSSIPNEVAVQAALTQFSGAYEQVPPQVSAKRVDGKKSYDLVRKDKGVELKPVQVTVSSLLVRECVGATVRFEVTASAGFYVRSLARDLGRALGCGAHLAALRRTKSGTFDIGDAITFDDVERLGPAGLEAHLISPAAALSHFPAVTANLAGFKRATHGNSLAPHHLAGQFVPSTGSGQKIRILAEDGSLIALADSRGGELHPTVVLAER